MVFSIVSDHLIVTDHDSPLKKSSRMWDRLSSRSLCRGKRPFDGLESPSHRLFQQAAKTHSHSVRAGADVQGNMKELTL